MPLEEPLLHEAYVFGELLDGKDPIDGVELALTLNLPPAASAGRAMVGRPAQVDGRPGGGA